MNITIRSLGFLISLMVLFNGSAWAAPEAQLKLWKKSEHYYGSCGHCSEFITFSPAFDTPDFTEFSHYFLDGYYTADLTGPEGATVTLYGDRNFAKDRGLLVIVKKDDRLVSIQDLESFTANTWSERPATEKSGAFRAYYQPFPQFARNVASLAWEQSAN
ncbi:MAG: hypothetical protein G3M78_06355 [Candidatus Nitrohelix vancouverensis]|uniref:NosL family protein n=1 Tax=Candidatus Nitrohelix vancouverensis TaxID=2705534 RepID=A0A7T0G346_9BACT|nr:MAG: hypothetical protein G3M78_06355 [Candidatus Nitrohelix vancouverensis]